MSINSIVFFDVSSNVRFCLHVMQSVLIGYPQPQESFLPFSNHFSTFSVCCIQLCIFREESIFHSPFLLLTLSKYCCVVWHTLFLLSLCKQTGCDALFHYTPQINYICYIPLISWSFFILLFCHLLLQCEYWQCFLRVIVTVQPARAFFTILPWCSTFTEKLLLCQTLLFPFCTSFSIFFSFFHPSFHLGQLSFPMFQWHLFFLAITSPCYPYSFVCCWSHVACHSSFCFIINLFKDYWFSYPIHLSLD